MKAVVAGAGGFIGGHLVGELLARGDEVMAVDIKPLHEWRQEFRESDNRSMDLREFWACRSATRRADAVFDLAADMGGIGYITRHHRKCLFSVLIGANLLRAARLNDVGRFFFSSSACVYPHDTVSSEDDPVGPDEGYGWEKLYMERLCGAVKGARVLRYDTVYGPHCATEGPRAKVVLALCHKIALAKKTGEKSIEIWGDGRQERAFLYIDDCIRATLLMTEGHRPGPLNIGGPEMITVRDLAMKISEIAAHPVELRPNPKAPTGAAFRRLDCRKARDKLGWAPLVSLDDGLKKTYEWAESQI